MAWETDWLDLMPRSITVEPWASEDSGGKVTYGTGVVYQCYIKDDAKVWRWEDGREVQSRRTIYVHGSSIGRKDRITLPAGYSPLVVIPVWLVRHDDNEGYHHTEIYV